MGNLCSLNKQKTLFIYACCSVSVIFFPRLLFFFLYFLHHGSHRFCLLFPLYVAQFSFEFKSSSVPATKETSLTQSSMPSPTVGTCRVVWPFTPYHLFVRKWLEQKNFSHQVTSPHLQINRMAF